MFKEGFHGDPLQSTDQIVIVTMEKFYVSLAPIFNSVPLLLPVPHAVDACNS